jgi:hypothetical protein
MATRALQARLIVHSSTSPEPGGEGGIRTHEAYRPPLFESGTINHSDTSPHLLGHYTTLAFEGKIVTVWLYHGLKCVFTTKILHDTMSVLEIRQVPFQNKSCAKI